MTPAAPDSSSAAPHQHQKPMEHHSRKESPLHTNILNPYLSPSTTAPTTTKSSQGTGPDDSSGSSSSVSSASSSRSFHESFESMCLPQLVGPNVNPFLNVLVREFETRGTQSSVSDAPADESHNNIHHQHSNHNSPSTPTKNPFFTSPLYAHPLNTLQLKMLLLQFSSLDTSSFNLSPSSSSSNQYSKIGEREARIYSELVAERHYHLGHGIGRSGDIFAVQPKALGSSLIYAIAKRMMLQMLRLSMHGAEKRPKSQRRNRSKKPPAADSNSARSTSSPLPLHAVEDILLLPMATGMSLVLTMRALIWRERFQFKNPNWHQKRYVLWNRIDQKTCFKSIISAGFEPIIVENVLQGDQLVTNLDALEQKMEELGSENIVCVLSTTSCFAPRTPDRVCDIATLCKRHNIAHVINNAYGVQSASIMNQIARATFQGRVDAFVQSTDKNFLVPVGGAVVASQDASFIKLLSETYPGRASMAPILDIFITCAQSDANTWKDLWKQRKRIMEDHMIPQLKELCEKHGERILNVKNPVSMAITLQSLENGPEKSTLLGSKLFYKGVTGARVVVRGTKKHIVAWDFQGYGSHCNEYPHDYLVFACAIGITESDVRNFIKALDSCLKKMKRSKKA